MFFRQRPGANLIEVLVAAVLAGVVLMAIGGFVVGMAQKSRQEADRDFAQRKALQILEELNTEQRRAQNIEGLTRFADQGPRFELTLAKVGPEDAISGNPSSDGAYRFIRTVSLDRVPGSEDAFQATVKVWRNTPRYTSPGIPPEKPTAVVSTILRNQLGHTQPVQVVKAYVLSIENIAHLLLKDPSQTADMLYPNAADMRTRWETAVADFEQKNPWIKIDYQYITRLSVGRDDEYKPYINKEKWAADGTKDPLKWLYFYPGKTKSGLPSFFSEEVLGGQLRVGAAGTSDEGLVESRRGYAFADEFNHPVRYPLEFMNDTANQTRSAPRTIAMGNKESNLSMRQLLEGMLSGESAFKNALIVNLHGAAFPALALRNYADPARDLESTLVREGWRGSSDWDDGEPDDDEDWFLHRARRVVTHPMNLVTPADQPVRLLVHAFMENGRSMPRSGSGSTPLAGGSNWTESSFAREARIRVPNLRPYFAQHNNPSATGNLANDLRITVIQREGNRYKAERAWPSSTDTWSFPKITDSATHEALPGGGRAAHTGPHANAHPDGNRHHGGNAAAAVGSTHGQDPYWDGDDLVVSITDMEYDMYEVTNGGDQYGLNCEKLHGLQYFPDPYLPFMNVPDPTGLGSFREARNSARVILEFRLNNAAAGQRFEVRTQLKMSTVNPMLFPDGFHLKLNHPTVSRTWFYGPNTDVPWTDRVQLVGDPRHNPYADLRQANILNAANNPAALAINRYWTDFDRDSYIYGDIDNSFGPGSPGKAPNFNAFLDPSAYTPISLLGKYYIHIDGSQDSWSGMKFNGPAYFDIWRRALTSSNATLMNPFGQPMRFVLLGGEFDLGDSINSSSELRISRKPFEGGSGDSSEIADGLFQDERPGWVARTETDHTSWYAKPWLGELIDSALAHHGLNSALEWRQKGNIRAEGGDGNDHVMANRVPIASVVGFDPLSDKTNTNDRREPGEAAIRALLQAEGPSGSQIDVDTHAAFSNATRTTLGTKIQTALGLPELPETSRTRGGFELTGGGAISGTANVAPGRLDWLPGMSSGLYLPTGLGSKVAVGAFQLNSDTPAASDTGASKANFVLSMLDGDVGATGVVPVLQIALAAGVDAHHAATKFSLGAGNVDPLPRIRMYKPLKDATVGGGGSVPLEWYSKWIRADGTPYSPHFIDTFVKPFNAALGHPNEVVYFVKYRPSAGAIFLAADVGSGGDNVTPFLEGASEPPLGITPIPDVNALGTPVKATWRLGGIANGDYIIRVEAYGRGALGQALGGNYAYQDLPVKVKR